MIRCLPEGVCSWNYVLDSPDHKAYLKFNWLNEKGAITLDGVPYEVLKKSVFSNEWALIKGGKEHAIATKESAFKRTFRFSKGLDEHILRAESAISRRFLIERGHELVARIFPDHAFTRRASIDIVAIECDVEIIVFAFWCAVLTWKRSTSN